MKTRYDDAIFKFKRRLLETAAMYEGKINADSLNNDELYLKLKKVRYKNKTLARYVNEYHLPAYDNINTIQENPSAMNLKEVTWFSNSRGDFHGLFVTQELYRSIIRYYRYSARDNLKDEQLEKAIKDWKAALYPKPTLKELLSKLFKGKQK